MCNYCNNHNVHVNVDKTTIVIFIKKISCQLYFGIANTQQTHYAMITSLLRQNVVILTQLRQNDVVLTLYRRFHYVMCSVGRKWPMLMFTICFLFFFNHVPIFNSVFNKSIEVEWRIYASVNYVRIGSDNGLLPVRRQAIIWTNAAILIMGPLGYISVKFE